MTELRVPFFKPDIGQAEIDAVVETLRSGWLTTGPKTRQFEQEFALRVGAQRAIAVNSATAALHLAVDALGIGPGDEVLVPTMTFTATAEVVVHRGGTPILVDCLADTLCIDPADAARRVTPRTKAIMPVHFGGHPCDMEPLWELAKQHQLKVIDDAAHALPAAYRGRPVGTLADATCFSFYANKTITTGEGGMLTTGDADLADRVQIRSLHGMSKDAWKRFSAEGSWYYEVVYPGYKYNLTDVAAALGLVQLSKCDDLWQGRCRAAAWYHERFVGLQAVTPPPCRNNVQHAWHLYFIQLDVDRLRITRNEFIQALNAAGIGTSVHYVPLHMHPWYRDTYGFAPEDFPTARRLFDRIVTLPLYPRMTEADVDYVAGHVRQLVSRHLR